MLHKETIWCWTLLLLHFMTSATASRRTQLFEKVPEKLSGVYQGAVEHNSFYNENQSAVRSHHDRHMVGSSARSKIESENQSVVQIGSHPPNCQDKCNMCHPCQAVQVPTPQAHVSVQFSPRDAQFHAEDANYNPESWKCKCGNRFFNPGT